MRHLIDPLDFTREETDALLDLACRIRQDPAAYQDAAARKRLATLFYEPSTRTRLSFEAAMLNLGGRVLGFPSHPPQKLLPRARKPKPPNRRTRPAQAGARTAGRYAGRMTPCKRTQKTRTQRAPSPRVRSPNARYS